MSKYVNVIGSGFNKGMFSQILGWTLQMLPYIDYNYVQKGIIPKFRLESHIYGEYPSYSIIPTLISPKMEPTVVRRKQREFIKKHHFKFIEETKNNYNKNYLSYKTNFKLANKMFNKYFKINNEITDCVNKFVDENFNGFTLGIHFRGTDKIPHRSNKVTIDLFCDVLRDILKTKEINTIFLCSDTKYIIEKFIENINKIDNKIKVIYYKQELVNDFSKRGFHIRRCDEIIKAINENDLEKVEKISKYNNELAKNALKDSLLLSRCNMVIKTQSQLSAWAKIFNPDIDVLRIGGMQYFWWPEVFIPLYKTNNKELQEKLDFVNRNDIPDTMREKVSDFSRYNLV